MNRSMVLLFLVGCIGGKGDLNGPTCEETPTVVALDEVTALGFAAQALIDVGVGSGDETFVWTRDESSTGLALSVVHDGGEARFIESVAVYPEGDGPQPAIDVICDDRVEVDVDVSFVTDDGAFAEGFETVLTATVAERAEWFHELDPDALTGTYDMDVDIEEPEWDERSLWIRGVADADGSSGEVHGQISGEGECDGETCSAWAMEVAVGTWGVEP